MMMTWFWKDDLHIDKRLYYGQILGAGVAALVSLEMLPYLIAAQGDNDARTLYEKNRLPHLSLQVYEHIERQGVTASNQLPVSFKDRYKALIPLQQRYLLTKHSLTGRTRESTVIIGDCVRRIFPMPSSRRQSCRSPRRGRPFAHCLRKSMASC